MARVTLVNPNDASCYTFFNKASRDHARRLPLGQAYVAAVLLKAGHEVATVDASALNLSVDDIVHAVVATKPDYVGIGGTTPLYNQMAALSRRVKAEIDAKVVMGGPHVSSLPEPTLRTSAADYVCIGEAEESIVALVGGANPASIPGIAWSGGETTRYRLRLNQSVHDTVRAVDLNVCPIPARRLWDHSYYLDTARGVNTPQTGAMFSRGCPGKCGFCGAADTLVRWRHLDNVLVELRQIVEMGIPNLFVMDDTYTNQKRRVLDLCRRIVEEGIHLRISVQLRLDQIDREVCDALYASGVRYVGPGIESGSERIMKAIGKGPKESKAHMREKVALLHEYDWTVRCSYVFGMVGETEADIMETIAFAKELKADESAFSILTPYPDSPLWDVALRTGKVDPYMDFDRFLYYHTIGCNLSEVPADRLLELHELAYRETVMIVHVYTVVWNEEYMMPYFLRHYETVADRIFVIDDASTDRTRDIVVASPKATLLDYPHESGLDEENKARVFSHTYRTHSRGIADWVICVDSDEFIYHAHLRDVLAAQRAAGALIIKPDRGMILGAASTPHTDGQLYDACPVAFECRQYAKPVIFDPALDVRMGRGQHRVRAAAPQTTNTGIILLHCCYLSPEWIADHMQRRWARMTLRELQKNTARGLTAEAATHIAMQSYKALRPWAP